MGVMERTTWGDDESSSSWEDAEFESLLGEERVESADMSKPENEAEQQTAAGDDDQTVASAPVFAAREEITGGEHSLRRRKVLAWRAEYSSHPPEEPPLGAVVQESSIWRGGSLDIANTLALALEEDAREKARLSDENRSSGGADGDGARIILESLSELTDEVEVEETESQARGSLASFSFQESPRPRVGPDADSSQSNTESLWPADIDSDDEEEVAPVRKRVHVEVFAAEVQSCRGEQLEQKRARADSGAHLPAGWREDSSASSDRSCSEEIVESESVGSSEISQVKEVYRMPEADYVPPENEDTQGQLLLLPAAFIIQAIGFQVRLIGKAFSVFMWVFNLFCCMFWTPVAKTLEAKDLAAGTINQGVSFVSQIPPRIRARASDAGPQMGKLWRKMGVGCLAATYVVVVLISLLVPAIVLDYAVMSKFVEAPFELREVLHLDYTQPKPNAVVNLLPPVVLVRAKSYAAAHPDKIVRTRAVPMSHKLEVTVILTLPESDYNRRLGMFQISVELLSVRAHVLARSSRPCMLQFRSSPVRYAKTLVLGLPLLMGLSQEYQTLSVRVLEKHEERVVPTASVRIYLEPKAGFAEGHGLPELYSAGVLIKSKLPWIKSLIYTWRWTFYVWSAFWLFMLEVGVILLCCRQALVPTSWRSLAGEPPETREGGYRSPRGKGASNVGERKSNKGKRRVSFQDEVPTANVVLVPRDEVVAPPVTPSDDVDTPTSLPLPQLEDTFEPVSAL